MSSRRWSRPLWTPEGDDPEDTGDPTTCDSWLHDPSVSDVPTAIRSIHVQRRRSLARFMVLAGGLSILAVVAGAAAISLM